MTRTIKKSFVFYASWRDVLADYPAEVRLEVYDAVIEYAISGTLSELKPLAGMAFSFIKRDIDRDRMKYDDIVVKRGESGKKGAEARWNKTSAQNMANAKSDSQSIAKIANAITPWQNMANMAVDVDVDVNDDVIKKEPPCGGKKESARHFQPPTLEEISDYIREKGYLVNAERFYAYYQSNGWKVGRNPMKDWRAAVRTWNAKEKEQQIKQKPKHDADNYTKPTADRSLEDIYGGLTTDEDWT